MICNRLPQLGLFSKLGEFIGKIGVLEMGVLWLSIGIVIVLSILIDERAILDFSDPQFQPL